VTPRTLPAPVSTTGAGCRAIDGPAAAHAIIAPPLAKTVRRDISENPVVPLMRPSFVDVL
jgi:hypothetical protein